MKYVNFDSISIKNFLSVGEDPVEIDFNAGLNIITGNNKDKVDRRNGVGKSTVADSIYFAIFGSTLRDLKKEHIVNNITQRNCEVELKFHVNIDGVKSQYKLIRKLSPTKCYLYKDSEDITRDSIQNTTEYIAKLLNTTPDVFQNCIIMTVNNAIPFMAKKKLDKRKFIEGIFNLQVFSNMLNTVRGDYNKVVRELDIECTKYEEISNSLGVHTEQKQNYIDDRARSLAKLEARREVNNRHISEHEKQAAEYTDVSVSKIHDNISKIEALIPDVESKIQNILTKHSEYNTLIDVHIAKKEKISVGGSECPVCLSKIDNDHRHYIDEHKEKLDKLISELGDKSEEYKIKLSQAKELLGTLKDKRDRQSSALNEARIQKQDIKNINERIKQLKSINKDIADDIKSLGRHDTSIDRVIAECEKRLDRTQNDINDIKKTMSRLDIIKFVVSEEGVKSYIVKKILQLFNAKLSHYLKKMDSNCICIFNEYFEEEIINEKGKPCSYFNFSGAERKNIDLACLFAFMDIRRLQGDVAFNFSMYDELFDSSLDERGVELVIDILKERIEQHNECVMVISHRKESVKLATGEIIFLEKQNGVTVRVETPETELK
jgi:DNA repair exonuclease SbcCD ATPase subunit